MLDIIEHSGASTFDIHGIGVTGYSRWGKGAFVVGFMDYRIAPTMPQEPSAGRRPPVPHHGQTLGRRAHRLQLQRLELASDNFAPFVFSTNTSNVVQLPIDTHAMIAAIAPRGILVLENPQQTQMGAPPDTWPPWPGSRTRLSASKRT